MSKTVLIIDDDRAFLRRLSDTLTEGGYRVLEAGDGKAALATLERLQGEIDLLIVDLGLPEVSGFEIIGTVARKPRAMKMIATTGIYRDCFLEQATYLGAHSAIRKPPSEKPFPGGEWLKAVREVLNADQTPGAQSRT